MDCPGMSVPELDELQRADPFRRVQTPSVPRRSPLRPRVLPGVEAGVLEHASVALPTLSGRREIAFGKHGVGHPQRQWL